MLTISLWKEWRVFQPTLLAVAGIAVVASPLLFLLPVAWQIEDFIGAVTICAMAAIFVTLGGELLPYERNRKGMEFLGRLPNGQRTVFVAKLLFLLASLLVFACLGYLIAEGWALLIRPTWIVPTDSFHLVAAAGKLVVWGIWAFALSSWINQPTLAPVVAGLLVFVIRPILENAPLFESRVTSADLIGSVNLTLYYSAMTVGVLVLAATTYLRHLDKLHCRRLRQIGWACFVTPWILGTWQCQQSLTPDPQSGDFVIHEAFAGSGRRYAFLNTQTGDEPKRAIVVNLGSGEWRVEGYLDRRFQTPGQLAGSLRSALIGEHNFVHLYGRDLAMVCYDGNTSELFDSGTIDQIRSRHRDRIRESNKNTSSIRLPNGQPAWIMDGILETTGSDGQARVLDWSVPEQGHAIRLLGHGIWFISKEGSAILDLAREHSYSVDDIQEMPLLVLPEGWLSFRDDGQGTLYDPDTKKFSAVEAIDGSHGIMPIGNGRVLSYRPSLPKLPGYIRLIDLRTGEQTDIAPPSAPAGFSIGYLGPNRVASQSQNAVNQAYTVDDRPLFELGFQHDSKKRLQGVATFDPETHRFGPLVTGNFRPISFPSSDTMLTIVDEQRIERVNLVTGEREILFPRR